LEEDIFVEGREVDVDQKYFVQFTHILFIFVPIPLRVVNRTEKLQRDFLWGGIKKEFKFHLVSTICFPMQYGRLGVRNLIKFNQTLLGKWLWRYATESDELWCLVMEARNDSLSNGCSKDVAVRVRVRKHIRRKCGIFLRFIKYEVGDGSKIRLWHDVWCGDQPLKEAFSRLFSIACCKEEWVVDNMQISNGLIQWNVSFVRSVQDWEVDLVFAFFGVLNSLRWRPSDEDCIWWIPSKRKKFEVRSFFH
jgi:hypothetical protein